MVKPVTERPDSKNDSKYKGVRKRKWGKWVSEIRLPNCRQRIWLGSYDTPEKAARAFDAALFCLRGCTAAFNFPDNPPDISGGRSLTPSEIQAAAARFANSEPRLTHSDHSFSSSSSSELQMESPSPSELQMESPSPSELQMESPSPSQLESKTTTFLEDFSTIPDFGIFPGFDDLSNDFFLPPLPNIDYGDENFDGIFPQESFLWNF